MTHPFTPSVICCFAVAMSTCLAATADVPEKSKPAEPLRSPADRPVDIVHIALNLNVDLPKKFAGGTATIDLVALRELSSIRFNAVDFDVTSVRLARGENASIPVEFRNDGEFIEILLGDFPLAKGTRATVEIEYAIRNPSSGLHFFGPSEEEPDVPYVVWSQGESITNRYWVPCFDHPNEMQTTEMTVTTTDNNEVISNGRLISKKKNGDGTITFHWLQDKPHTAYLITLIVGEFHVVRETWRGKPVVYYVPNENSDDVGRSFDNTKRMLDYFSDTIGVEYPWDQYAQTCVEGFGGGMENTSATTLGTSTLHDERAHLDFSSDGLVAHELAHQWFGDYVTCKDWSHLWLNEGFASYMEPVWYEFDLGQDEYDYAIYQDIRGGIRGGKKRPVVDRHYDKPGDMFDGRAYPKGSSILHTLRHRVGTEDFWGSIKNYLTKHAHQPVETSDLRKAFEQHTGRGLDRFFYDWTERAGAPTVKVSINWSEEDKLLELSVKQTQKDDAFHFPFEAQFHLESAEPVSFQREITEKNQNFFIPLASRPRMVIVDPDQAVIMELEEKKGRDLWSAQLTDGPRMIDRLRAAKYFEDASKERDAKLVWETLMKESFWGVGIAMAEALGAIGGDDARDGLLACLTLDHPKVRRACASELGTFHGDEKVEDALLKLIRKGDPSYRVESAAISSYAKLQPEGAGIFLVSLLDRDSHRDQIRSAALSGLGKQEDASGLETLLEWAKPGKRRFTRMSAMRAMVALVENVELTDQQEESVVASLKEALKTEHRFVQGSAIRALGKLGEDARSALPALRRIEAHANNSRLSKGAKDAIKSITSSAPEHAQLDDVRDELESLRKENEKLRERFDRLEAISTPVDAEAKTGS